MQKKTPPEKPYISSRSRANRHNYLVSKGKEKPYEIKTTLDEAVDALK